MNQQNKQNFDHFRKQLEMLGADLDASARRVVSQAADVGLIITKKNTPVGQYKDGRQGGTLRRGWLKKPVYKAGSAYVSGYFNNVEYALYVNNGHRIVTRDGKTVGYVKGVRMLEQGTDEARRQMEGIFQEEIARVKRKGGW